MLVHVYQSQMRSKTSSISGSMKLLMYMHVHIRVCVYVCLLKWFPFNEVIVMLNNRFKKYPYLAK